MNIISIITETIHILGDSLDVFKHRVMMCKSVIYRMHFEYHTFHNCVYSDAGGRSGLGVV